MTRWVVSPLDACIHVLADGDCVGGVLVARCGHQLPTMVRQHDQPTPGTPCEDCRVAEWFSSRTACCCPGILIHQASSPPVLPAGRRWRPPTPGGRPDPIAGTAS